MKRNVTSTIAVLAIIFSASLAGADTLILQNGLDSYAGTEDVKLVESTPSYNFGGVTDMAVRSVGTSSGWYTSLVKFDVSEIPAGATIQSATLSLYNYSKGSGTARINAYRMKREWVEGNGDGTWNYGRYSGATYSCYDRNLTETFTWDSRPDGAAGARGTGDAESTYAASANWTDANAWVDLDVVTDVQAWIDGDVNNGWTLREATYNIVPAFYSSEYSGDTALRPKLTVTYEAIPEPATMGLLAVGGIAAFIRRRK